MALDPGKELGPREIDVRLEVSIVNNDLALGQLVSVVPEQLEGLGLEGAVQCATAFPFGDETYEVTAPHASVPTQLTEPPAQPSQPRAAETQRPVETHGELDGLEDGSEVDQCPFWRRDRNPLSHGDVDRREAARAVNDE